MDKMIIKGLEIYAYHGVFPEEKERGQRFVLDIALLVDLSAPCASDDLNDTINYSSVCDLVEQTMLEKKCDLIEHAAQRVCDAVLGRFPKVCEITLLVKKPQAPVNARIEYAAVELTRSR